MTEGVNALVGKAERITLMALVNMLLVDRVRNMELRYRVKFLFSLPSNGDIYT